MTAAGEALDQARQFAAEGRLHEAAVIYRRLLEVDRSAHELWYELAVAHLRAQQFGTGVDCLQQAVALSPNTVNYHATLGTALQMMRRPAEAVASLERALQIGPSTAQLCNNLALALKDGGRSDDALRAFDESLKLQPDYGNGYFNRANLLLELGRLDAAVVDYRHAIRLAPADAAAWCKLGMAFFDMGRLDEAISAYDRALEIQPGYPEARRNRAIVWLSRGDYTRGWPDYEWRLECEGWARRAIAAPRWQGQQLSGRTLFAYAEQGLGDTLQFIRYLPLVRAMRCRALVDAQAPLAPLLAQSGFESYLVPPGSVPPCDLHCALLSLPGLVPAAHGEPFWSGPYLAADSQRVASWRKRLLGLEAYKIGIAWAGNPSHPHDRFRSVELGQFAPLAEVAGVRLLSLQKGPGTEHLGGAGLHFEVTDLGPHLDASVAFVDTAAVMQCLDLVVTVDTAVAHLAGGLGVPVWVALEFSPDWRWLTQGETTAWYPSMRLFRQRTRGDWSTVFGEMAARLREIVKTSR